MSLENKCWDAFNNRDHKEAVRLLPLVKEQDKLERVGSRLLHLSSRNGWLDVTKDLITKYHCDLHERDILERTCLHFAAERNHVDVMRYLIDECHCDPMAVDRLWGRTPLHRAANYGKSAAAEYLLSTGKCDPLAKDKYGDTPFKLAKKRGRTDTLSVFKKFGGIKSSHPVDSYVNVLLVGNPGAGKSTLSHVIKDTAISSIVLGSFRNVGGVVACTAGIIPYKLQHRTLGNIILHDFAGHSEYYSSHSAVIENLLQGSGGVFLIVVNILEKEPVKQLHQWLTIVRNEAQKALNECHVIVIVSHVDEISNPVERRRRKEEIQEIIVKESCDSVFLDCRKLGGSGVDSFFNKLCSACESIRSTSGRNLSLYCHMMYGLLEKRKENILTLSDVMCAGKDNDDYFIPDKREDVLDVLDSLHSTGLMSVLKSEEKVWVVVNKGILLTEVDGILFAPETFKEHVDIASNTGSCPSLEVKELVIDPKELAYPVNTPRERTTYGIYNVLLAIKKRKPFLVNNKGQTELKEILPDESLSDISNLSLLGGRDIKEVIEITEEFKTPLTPIKLDIKDLATIIEELTIHNQLDCTKWYQFGLHLGLYDPRLKAIDTDYRGKTMECFRECMSAWEVPSLVPGSVSRPTDIFIPSWSLGQPAAMDVTVISLLQQLTLDRSASDRGYALLFAEERKNIVHFEDCRRNGIFFQPLAMETLGGWSQKAVSVLRSIGRHLGLRRGLDPLEVNNNDGDSGALIGLWSSNDDDYADGTSPTSWSGSEAILTQYMSDKKPVRYAQCWVFGGTLTTVLRTIGIPSRPVTNFESAHDADFNRAIDYYFDRNDKMIEDKSNDSIWNYHVWVEAWMTRPDLDGDYGGWQAVDATPQELSPHSRTMVVGPASIQAIKDGKDLKYDNEFVIAEVNADIKYHVEKSDGSFAVVSRHETKVGKHISTKAVGRNSREDVTSHYKYPEGSASERAALMGGSGQEEEEKRAVSFSAKLTSGRRIGEDLTFGVTAKIDSPISGNINVTAVFETTTYTGVVGKEIKKSKSILRPNNNATVDVTFVLKATEYRKHLGEQPLISVTILGYVEEPEQAWVHKIPVNLELPELTINIDGKGDDVKLKSGRTVSVKVTLKNPLKNESLTNVTLHIEGTGLIGARTLKSANVPSNGSITNSFSITPRSYCRVSERNYLTLIVTGRCNQLKGLMGTGSVETPLGKKRAKAIKEAMGEDDGGGGKKGKGKEKKK
uniref:Transglutaminase-like domain-containing protein n=1 Tax=Amphimedon queenslandica TaxID=400682 RepID=A0A1X7UJE9_AMPQE